MTGLDEEFLKFVTKCDALKFGEFVLKDGSKSDVFFNSGSFDTGLKLRGLARFFANKINNIEPDCTLIYGSAYKGIPLATAVSMELSNIKGKEVGYLFNRKEKKLHGDGGDFIGKIPVEDDIIVFVDDVITSGQTKQEGITCIRNNFLKQIKSIFVAIDRRNSYQDIDECPVHSLTTLDIIKKFVSKKRHNGR